MTRMTGGAIRAPFALANRAAGARGVWRAAAAVAAGAAAVLAMAPFHLAPILFVSLTGLVWLLDGTPGWRSAARVGWWFGFGYFLIGLHWIGSAFLVQAEVFGWMAPFAVAGLAATLGLFFALGAALARLFWSVGPGRILALAFGLGASEWLRGHAFTGLPWNTLGQVFSATNETAQAAAVFGLHGLTVLAVLIFASPAAAVGSGGRARGIVPVLGLGLLALIAAGGALRLAAIEPATVPGVRLRLVQPNLDQRLKLRPGSKDEVMSSYLRLSRQKDLSGITHVIWPESAFPFLVARNPDALAQIADLIPPGVHLMTGAARAEIRDDGRVDFFNSLYVMDDEARITAAYDKAHLVPFGEYLPFQNFLELLGFEQLTRVQGGFDAGSERALLQAGNAPAFTPLICYEIIFPGAASPPSGRPGWLLNVTNDAWFGDTIGPHQHLDQARLRAIEEGLPVIRVANTGISAVIDPYGRILASLPLESEGILDSELPAVTFAPPFHRYGWIMPFTLLLVVGCGSLATRNPRTRI